MCGSMVDIQSPTAENHFISLLVHMYFSFFVCLFLVLCMFDLSYQHILGYGQLLVLDESLSVLLIVS